MRTCKECFNELIVNQASNKDFYYCRTCKLEKTIWGYGLPKLEEKPAEVPHVYNDDFYNDTYGNGTYNKPHILTQDEIDKMFADMYTGDLT